MFSNGMHQGIHVPHEAGRVKADELCLIVCVCVFLNKKRKPLPAPPISRTPPTPTTTDFVDTIIPRLERM